MAGAGAGSLTGWAGALGVEAVWLLELAFDPGCGACWVGPLLGGPDCDSLSLLSGELSELVLGVWIVKGASSSASMAPLKPSCSLCWGRSAAAMVGSSWCTSLTLLMSVRT